MIRLSFTNGDFSPSSLDAKFEILLLFIFRKTGCGQQGCNMCSFVQQILIKHLKYIASLLGTYTGFHTLTDYYY